MARTIAQIKTEITTTFMADANLALQYGFTVGASFDDEFSKVSLESILFFIVASAIWTLETLFDVHVSELNTLIDTKKPHRLKWYRDKALAFQYGRSLAQDQDTYDTVVESEKVVKYASAQEYGGRVYVKVATGDSEKTPLPSAQETALVAYMADVKDAGVTIVVANKAADHYSSNIDIYYDPMVLNADGMSLATGEPIVRNTILDYVQNQIPFNGEYRNAALVDTLQALDGVVIPEMKLAQTVTDEDFQAGGSWSPISARCTPASGYFKVYAEADLVLTFIPYEPNQTV